MNDVLISVVTWNSADVIETCLQSIIRQTYKPSDILIVDNNSSDRTTAILDKYAAMHPISVFKSPINTGFCGGHNYNIKNSKSKYVLLVNPDVIMKDDYLENAIRVMKNYPDAGTVCGLLLQDDQPDPCVDGTGLDYNRTGIMVMRNHGKKLSSCFLNEEEVFGADGALPLYRRSMIDNISYKDQFFDESFFAHKEDWDVSWRSRIYGWKTIFTPKAIAIHPRVFKPKSLRLRSSIQKEIKVHSVKNQLILLLKNQSMKMMFRHLPYIFSRQVLTFFFILFFERYSLKAYSYIYSNFSEIMSKRRIVQKKIAGL